MLNSIQAMRAMAAMMVVAFHLSSMTGERGLLASGVDIFFVISGFIMVYSTEGRRPSFREFMRARVFRIVPLYWIATMALIPIWWARSEPLPDSRDVALSLLFIFHTDLQSALPVPVLGAGWTLNYEMFFYLVFGATLAFGRKNQIAILAALFVGLVMLRPLVDRHNAFAFRMTSPVFFEFLAGCVIAAVLPRLEKSKLYSRRSCCALMLGAVVLAILANRYFPGLPRVLVMGGPAAILVLGAIGLESSFSTRAFAPLVFLGGASYSLYLFHLHAILIFGSIAPEMPDALFQALAFSTAVLCSVLLYLYVETPIRAALRWSQNARFVKA